MFQVMDLSNRLLSDLKDIAKKFGIDSKGMNKGDIILKIIDAQNANPDLAAKLSGKKGEAKTERRDPDGKRPRKSVKLEPIVDDTVEPIAEEEVTPVVE
ncbi:MAG TPA: Rho termination factor N-terminal domain-containing protein, partial [Bacteroidia bacterium]|nr:Rho termination factor N-terminal domain-containing protein [Bacteroidia bacterium]